MQNMLKILAVIFLTIISTSGVKASISGNNQNADTLDFLTELLKIQDAYGSADGVWATWVVDFYEYDDDTITTHDFDISSLNVSQSKFRYSIGDVVTVQDQLYNVTLYNDDSVMYVRSPIDLYKSLFQIDLLDSLFHLRQIHQVYFSTEGYTRIITIEFENESPYITYQLAYDSASYMIEWLGYTLKRTVLDAGATYIPAEDYSDFTRVLITNLGTTVGPQEDDQFNTGFYIRRQSKAFVAVSPYTGYEVVDSTDQ